MLGYSQLTMLWWFQRTVKGLSPYIYMYHYPLAFLSRLPRVTLSRTPALCIRSMLVAYLKYNRVHISIPGEGEGTPYVGPKLVGV